MVSARARTESRGAHFRDDHPLRDDDNWMQHTLAYREDDGTVRLDYKPVDGRHLHPHGAQVLMAPSLRRASTSSKVKRYNPEADTKPHWEEYHGASMEGTDRVLDALHKVKWDQDGTLAFRRSCAHGVCGSDAMVINGANGLACIVLVQDVGRQDHRRAHPGPAGDQGPGGRHGAVLRPVPLGAALPDQHRRPRLPRAPPVAEERERFDDTTKCILCAACTTSCPVFWGNSGYVGPAAIVNAHRFIFDSRDEGRRRAPRHPQRALRRVALPHRLQLLRRLPPGHQGHPGHRRGEAGDPLRPGLTGAGQVTKLIGNVTIQATVPRKTV